MVGIRLLGFGALLDGNVPQIDADAGPGRRAAAHRVDEHIIRLQEASRFGMPLFPARKSGEGLVSIGRLRDHDQRHLDPPWRSLCGRLFCAGRCHAGGFALAPPEMRWPGSIAEAFGFVPGGKFEEGLERSGGGVHGSMRITDFCKAAGHGEHREVGGIAIRDFVPGERCGNARVRDGAHRVGGSRSPVLGVLVVIEENTVAFFFPPFGGGQCGQTALDCAGQGKSGTANIGEGPARVKANIDMHSSRAGSLGPTTQAGVLKDRFHFESDAADVGPGNSRARVEVDAHFIRVIEIGRADWMRVEFDAAEIDDPGQTRRVIDDELFSGAARRKRQCDGAKPVRTFCGGALLVEGFRFGSVHKTLEDERPITDGGERSGGNGKIVADEFDLGEANQAGEVDFFRMADSNCAAFEGKSFGGFGLWRGLGHAGAREIATQQFGCANRVANMWDWYVGLVGMAQERALGGSGPTVAGLPGSKCLATQSAFPASVVRVIYNTAICARFHGSRRV